MRLKFLLVSTLLASAGLLSAGPITWQVVNAQFQDGTVVTGSFVFDADTTTFSGLNITSSGGSSIPATSSWVFDTNNLPNSEQNALGATGFEAVDALSGDETGAHFVSLFSTLGPLMTDAGGTIMLNDALVGTCADALCTSADNSQNVSLSDLGEFTAPSSVPEPSTLLLNGSALLLAVFRKKLLGRKS